MRAPEAGGWWRSPALPLAVVLAAAPAVAVLQFRSLAPIATIGLALVALAGWRGARRVPWPRPRPMLAVGGALLAWAGLSAAWAPEPDRVLTTAASLAALLGLAGMAARALEAAEPAHLRRVGTALAAGLGLGAALLALDHASGNLLRLAVRGFPEWTPFMGFGLKPAASFLALLLPLALAARGVKLPARLGVLAAGAAAVLWLPGEAARIALLAGLAVMAVALAARRALAMAMAAGLAGVVLAMPLLVGAVASRAPDLSALPATAQHRVLIWDFVLGRIAERPGLGWGMEASREVPGGRERFGAATLDRFGLVGPAERAFFALPGAQRLPLHPHNAALQLWLELGAVGAVLGAALAAAAALAAGALGAGRAPFGAAALGVAASAAVTGALSFGVWQPWWVGSLCLAAVAAGALARAGAPPRQAGQ